MKTVKTLLVLLFCVLYYNTVFGAVMDSKQFFDFENSKNITRIELSEKTTGNIVYIEKEEIQKTYELLQKMKFSNIISYDAYARENNVGTSNYTMKFYSNHTLTKQIEITQEKIYNTQWVLFPDEMPNDFYYYAKYNMLIKQNYKKPLSEEDFYQNKVLWKNSPIIFKNESYYDEENGVMVEFETLNTVLNSYAVYDLDTQMMAVNGVKTTIFGEQKNGVTYIAVKPFVELLSYSAQWDDSLKILSIQPQINHNERWEKLRGIPQIYGNMETTFEDNISFAKFLNIDRQQNFTKMTIKNEKTNYTTTITDETILQKLQDILSHTTVYQIEKQNKQADESIFRYAITLYQNEKAIKSFTFTSENVIKDDVYRVSMSTAFFETIYKINEINYAKALLNQWKVI